MGRPKLYEHGTPEKSCSKCVFFDHRPEYDGEPSCYVCALRGVTLKEYNDRYCKEFILERGT